MMKKSMFLFVFLFFTYLANAQNSVNSSGGDASSADGSVSYSIGQVFYQNYSDAAFSVNEGVQQAYDIEVVSISELAEKLSIQLYPNPTTDHVILGLKGEEFSGLQYQLMDIKGSLLKQGNIQNSSESIGLNEFGAAMYLLHLIDNQTILKTFKIIKK